MSEHELWNELGNLYFLSGEYQQAIYAYKRSIRLDEAFGRPYSNLALAYVQQGKYEQAIDLYRRSIELLSEDQERAISWNRLGNVFRRLKNYREAIVAFQHADELDPENGEEREQPGWATDRAQQEEGDRDLKAEPGTQMIDPFPFATERAAAESGKEDEATATWAPIDPTLVQQDTFETLEPGALTTWDDPSIQLDDPETAWPDEPETDVEMPAIDADELTTWIPAPEEAPLDALDYTLEAVDMAAEIEEPPATPEQWNALKAFSDLRPEPPDPGPEMIDSGQPRGAADQVQSLADTRTPTGKGEAANVTITDVDIIVQDVLSTGFALSAEPEDSHRASAQELQGARDAQGHVPATGEADEPALSRTDAEPAPRSPEEVQEIEAGLAKYQRVVELNPKNARAWDTLGNLHKSGGHYKEALLAYQQAITNDPSKALFHHHLGLVYAHEGRLDDAIEAFQKVIELQPDHGLAHATLGGYYRKKGLEELAQKHIGIAMKSIYDSENEYNRACLAAICGNTEQALDLLRVALKNKQTYVDWILRDPDLDFIRKDPRFKQLISDYAR